MHLKQIKRLVDLSRYQEALVNYFSYAIFGVPMRSIWEVNIPRMQLQLKNKLEQASSQALREITVDYQIDSHTGEAVVIDAQLIKHQLNLDPKLVTWWRLDFVSKHLMPKIRGQFRVPLDADGVTKISVPFVDGEQSTAIFFTKSDPDLMEPSEGVISHKAGATAYSLCPLNEKQTIAQLLKLFEAPDLNTKQPTMALPFHLNGLLNSSLNDKIQGYVINILGLAQTGSEKYIDVALSYKREVEQLLAVVDPRLIETAVRSGKDNTADQPLLESKSQLGDGVNYNIEGVKRIGDLIIVHGWIVDPMNKVKSVKISSIGAKKEFDILHKFIQFNRPDVIKAFGDRDATQKTHYGFVAVAKIPCRESNGLKFNISVQTQANKKFKEEIGVSDIPLDSSGLAVLAGIFPDNEVTSEKCKKFYRPLFNALTHGQSPAELLLDKAFPTGVVESPKMKSPSLSVIIPLYGETRFELTQIPQFAALRQAGWEIILAVDDPNILEDVVKNTERLAANYGLPVRVVAPNRNLGFSGINNFAAARAKGKNLLFLNSDCFVTTAKPLRRAFEWLKNRDNGAAGFRLHYSNKTIQHDGMSVSMWHDNSDFYLNEHPRLGALAELMPEQIINDSACMLTAACLMIEKKLFDEVGGFDTCYLRGDFEDSDLCLKIISKGKRLGIVREQGIYHLERQSIVAQSDGLRQLITMVNSNIYSQIWQQRLAYHLPLLEVIQ